MLYVGIWDILYSWSRRDIVRNIEISGVCHCTVTAVTTLTTAPNTCKVRNSQNRNIVQHPAQHSTVHSNAGSDLDFALIIIGLIDHNNE